MARCMVFACGLPLSFWGDAVQYAAYILNRAPTNANPGRASPLKILTKQTPQLGKIVVFGSSCTVQRDPTNKNFSQRAQQGMIIGIGEEVKGYRVYLPKDKKVVTSQHVQNIETLNKTQNLHVQRLYQDRDSAEAEQESREQGSGAANQGSAGKENGTKVRRKVRKKSSKKKTWTRERHGPRNYKEAMHSQSKVGRMKAMVEELKALEGNSVWEQTFGVNYSVTFAAVIDMTCVKLILVLARKWRVPAKHGDVPNAYVKADKEEDLWIYIRVPQGMKVSEEILKELGVETDAKVALELKKALYGLKQAGRLWSKLLHAKLEEIGFHQSLVDMCVYYRYKAGVLIVVGVYVDDLL
ncbi:putative mitochondrial protein [Phytophthora megakarya]|uniref:Putative mitochondrial protein n=1 Tax=Phytophthora megakarya TaxID=4795 RepID=A0A225WD65_9STRA|nr:putative mitochondrial protein [Phytophthora megakarya]